MESTNIKVIVQIEDRMKAISDLACAIKLCAMALEEGTKVEISNNTFRNGQISVEGALEVNEKTSIIKYEDETQESIQE